MRVQSGIGHSCEVQDVWYVHVLFFNNKEMKDINEFTNVKWLFAPEGFVYILY